MRYGARMTLGYPGSKAGSGVWQRIVNQVPPVDVLISGFAGHCALLRKIHLPRFAVGLDIDPEVVQWWRAGGRQGVSVVCSDAVEWLERVVYQGVVHGHGVNVPWVPMAVRMKTAPQRALIYLDPPYLRGVLRRQDRPMYRYELTEQRHGQLLQLVKQLPCLVLVNHPRCELYQEWLGAWRTEDYRSMTRGGVMVEDCLWANYPAPTELQDYRFVGRNKRQRERVRRRVRNWVAALGRMGPLERGAILAAIDAECRDIKDKKGSYVKCS